MTPPVAASPRLPEGAPLAARRRRIRGNRWVGLVLCAPLLATAQAASAPADPALDARVQAISAELRCLVCQNQTIAESHAGLAVDLRRQVREMLARGDSKEQIVDYMTARYGDFVLYRPPVKASTVALWFGPAVLLVVAVGTLVLVLRRRARLPAERFEPDPDEAASEGPR
ncbi:MAG TPA: cytochrome c-type biogenesis protein [Methylibium sp.]|uniref:cytochrome c-type biogenesis protein n=1 Tax=Methylibium sp. TaxID=2067992 RepID=UPI002DB94F18|nr:cytochrome c-type biogenesis protein [Methylibium sp.]HEU4457866.1 cytochrome c-type biogenesis protein [Methylibium sp.]